MSGEQDTSAPTPSSEADRRLVLEALSSLAVPSEDAQKRSSATAQRTNDLYLEQLVEGLHLCPFAKDGRARGATARIVYFRRSGVDATELGQLLATAHEVMSHSHHEVTQLVFPGWALGEQHFDGFARSLTRLAHEARGGDEVLAVAPLHPHASYNDGNAYSLIPLFRRSPDPTIQWVRHDALARVARGQEKGSTFVDPAVLLAHLDTPPRKSLYERVAEANRRTAERVGIEEIERRFLFLHLDAQAAYAADGVARCPCSVVPAVDAQHV